MVNLSASVGPSIPFCVGFLLNPQYFDSFGFFFSKSWNGGISQNWGLKQNHEIAGINKLWNQEMRGCPVVYYIPYFYLSVLFLESLKITTHFKIIFLYAQCGNRLLAKVGPRSWGSAGRWGQKNAFLSLLTKILATYQVCYVTYQLEISSNNLCLAD